MRKTKLGLVALFSAALVVGGSASSVAAPNAATKACGGLSNALQQQVVGTNDFQSVARQALRHGCVAYLANVSPETLALQVLRGPDTGTVITIGSTGLVLTDIAVDSSGALYGVSFSALYSIDPATGAATFVGNIGNAFVNGLVFGPDGVLYASTTTGLLLTINAMTGAGTTVGVIGYGSAGDLAFAADGTLYMTAGDGLVAVDTTTGAGTPVGPIDFADVYGLVSSFGTLYGMTFGGELITIDPMTGAGTIVTEGGPLVYGAATLPNRA